MFTKILIANRGEIAVRVIRACRDLGVSPVAVYSEVDRAALHVRLADEAYGCGPPRATESYLRIDRLLAIAERAGVDAIHPGYGFLSENGDFADACAEHGIAFIGPSAAVLRSMGDKVTSREIMQAAGVPVVPGSTKTLTDAEAAAFADEIGLPVMVKASGGGGGRGLRVVERKQDLAGAIERARSEAAAAFGTDAIYIEKLLLRPRHIEVQILADSHGNTVHLCERECSIQRRHQKLLEEAPAVGVSAALRAALGGAALTAARAVGYQGAGTVEFLVDRDDAFYFLEMNTRVQVEHPVTEAITSIDIVKEMIRVAAGEPLGITQDQVAIHGHAIEARIYAEDPDRGFLPSPGSITAFRPPDGIGIRVDSGVSAGDAVTPHYDALLAKLIAWGTSREEAIDRLERALGEFAIGGIKTSIPFHQRVVRNAAFRAGAYDTGFVESERLGGAGASPAGSTGADEALRLALALTAIAGADASGSVPNAGAAAEHRCSIKQKGQADAVTVAVSRKSDAYRVVIDGDEVTLDAVAGIGGNWSLIENGRQYEVLITEKRPGRYEVRLGAHFHVLERASANSS